MFGLTRLKRWWTQRILTHHRIPITMWQTVVHQTPLLSHLPKRELGKLRELASLFLHDKAVVGAGDFELEEFMRVSIAAQASLLVLNLGLNWFDGWSEVIVYPDAFVVPRSEMDEAGVLHESDRGLSGEAWSRGPVILSWADIDPSIQRQSGSNVVLHEFAHKLDFLDGAAMVFRRSTLETVNNSGPGISAVPMMISLIKAPTIQGASTAMPPPIRQSSLR